MNLCVVYMSVLFVYMFFLEAVYVVFGRYMCFFDCKCKSLNRLGEHIKTTQTKHKETITQKSFEKNITNRNTGYPAHEPPRINISQVPAGK